MKEENGKLLATDGGQASAVLWLSAALPSHPRPAVEDQLRTDRQKAIHAKCPKGWLHDCLGEGLFSWGKIILVTIVIHTTSAQRETGTKNNTTKTSSLSGAPPTDGHGPGGWLRALLLNRLFCNNIPRPKPCLSPWLAGTLLPVPGAAPGTRHGGDGAPRPCCNTNRWLLHRAGEIQALSTHGIGGNVLQLFSLEISVRIAVMSAPSSRLPTWDHKHFVKFFLDFFLNPLLDCFCCLYGLTCTASL